MPASVREREPQQLELSAPGAEPSPISIDGHGDGHRSSRRTGWVTLVLLVVSAVVVLGAMQYGFFVGHASPVITAIGVVAAVTTCTTWERRRACSRGGPA